MSGPTSSRVTLCDRIPVLENEAFVSKRCLQEYTFKRIAQALI